jgi:hypothetical protein
MFLTQIRHFLFTLDRYSYIAYCYQYGKTIEVTNMGTQLKVPNKKHEINRQKPDGEFQT